jgi:FeS assembly SUF system protein
VKGDGTVSLRSQIVEALKTVYDPEIPVNIWEVGLIYEVEVNDEGEARVVMTLTSPTCPVAEILPGEVQEKVEAVEGVTSAHVELTWDPPWDPDMMSDAAKLDLGMY